MKELRDLVAGDKVARIDSRGWGSRQITIQEIVRVTKTQIIMPGYGTPRFRRDDGRKVGERWGDRIEILTDEHHKEIAELKLDNKISGLAYMIEEAGLKHLKSRTLSQLQQACKLLGLPKPKQESN